MTRLLEVTPLLTVSTSTTCLLLSSKGASGYFGAWHAHVLVSSPAWHVSLHVMTILEGMLALYRGSIMQVAKCLR
jgi:hypothetical protein